MRTYWDFHLAIIVTFLIIMITNPDYSELKLRQLCFSFQFEEDGSCVLQYNEDSVFHTTFTNSNFNNIPPIISNCNSTTYQDIFDNVFVGAVISAQSICCSNFGLSGQLTTFTALIMASLLFSNIYEETTFNIVFIVIRCGLFAAYAAAILGNFTNANSTPYCRSNSIFTTNAVILFVFLYAVFSFVEIARISRVCFRNRGVKPRDFCVQVNDHLELELAEF